MYQIKILIKGKMNPAWSDWFEELEVCPDRSGDTILRGTLRDQSALYGVISRLGSLGIKLLSVNCAEVRITGPPE